MAEKIGIGLRLVGLLAAGAFWLLWQPGSDSAPVAHSVSNAVIPNVTQADLDSAGIYTVTTAEALSPNVSAADALPAVVAHDGNGVKVLDSQLVQLSNAQYHNLLGWAVSLDPLSGGLIIAPSAGPPGNRCQFVLDGPVSFVLAFVDATTGKWVMQLQKAKMKSLASPPCPTG